MDRALVEKHLAHVVDSVELLRRRGRPQDLHQDPVQFGFVVHTLQTAVQAALDAAAIIVAERRLGEPATNRDLFEKLARDGWIDPAQAGVWKRIVAFRNVVVHRYLQIDAAIVRAIVEQNLEDLLGFVGSVDRRLRAGGGD